MSFGFLQFFKAHIEDFANESFASCLKFCVFVIKSNLLGVVRVVNRIVKHVYVEVFGVENGLVEICLTLYQLEFSLQNKVEFGYF